MNHVAGIMDNKMIIHGGANTETKKILADFGVFNLEKGIWMHPVLDNEGQHIGQRKMHTMQSYGDQALIAFGGQDENQ